MRVVTAVLICYWIALIFNFISVLATHIVASDAEFVGYTFVAGLIQAILFVPLSFFCWWKPLYHAYKNNSSCLYLLFFGNMGLQTVMFLVYALGIPYVAGAGFIVGGLNIKYNTAVGAMCIASGFLWLILGIVSSFLIYSVHRYYRSSGRTTSEASSEFQAYIGSNGQVRQVAVDAMKKGKTPSASVI